MGDMRRFLLPVAAATLALGVAAPAHAERLAFDDPVGDVYALIGGQYVQQGSVPNADLVRTVVNHRTRDVRVRATYAHLDPGSAMRLSFLAEFRVEDGNVYTVHVTTNDQLRHVRVRIELLGSSGTVRCPGARATVDPDGSLMKLVVPRACLNDPKTVRFRGQAEALSPDQKYGDSAVDDEPFQAEGTRPIRAG